ncbi:MAG: SEC-C domain-containing protein [Deltaproteobacteria bacterium]|nr:SEC-C domain-containing protein [Deltaproteobacteria bacterium]MBI2534768.1 SEC-C domain-containing protein [Deltaproteobacteria bacterium]
MIDSENRLRVGGFKKTAKLGTETNPAVVHVRTEARLKEVSALFNDRGWKYKVGLEPDKPEDITALERLLNPPKPKRVEKRLGRNEPCSCGSGKKYKICCGE